MQPATEQLMDCPQCGRKNFTPRGLKAHACTSPEMVKLLDARRLMNQAIREGREAFRRMDFETARLFLDTAQHWCGEVERLQTKRTSTAPATGMIAAP